MFEWDDGNVAHIAEHGITPDEVEEAFADPRRLGVDAYTTPTERRWGLVGSTEEGRLLFVVYTRRGSATGPQPIPPDRLGSRIRVVTARDADPGLRRRYRRR